MSAYSLNSLFWSKCVSLCFCLAILAIYLSFKCNMLFFCQFIWWLKESTQKTMELNRNWWVRSAFLLVSNKYKGNHTFQMVKKRNIAIGGSVRSWWCAVSSVLLPFRLRLISENFRLTLIFSFLLFLISVYLISKLHCLNLLWCTNCTVLVHLII